MSVPKKRRTSGSRKRRASHHSIKSASLHNCPQCGAAKQPHRACPNCGTYKNAKVLKVKSALDNKKKK
ncbi:MAG: 50S ribosomal protein L32 [Candidatus Komeilibacteria bacterium]